MPLGLDWKRLGERVAGAREAARMTQQELADAVSLDRSAIAKVERGIRGVSAFEMSSIAQALGRRMEWFLSEPPPSVVSHRSHEGLATAGSQIDRLLEDAARDVELVASLDPQLVLPDVEPLGRPRTSAEADDLAGQARRMVGLDNVSPAADLVAVVGGVGLLCFSRDLGTDTADAGTVLLHSGAVSVINSNTKVGRRRLALAHELAHYLVADEYTVDWRVVSGDNSGVETLFDRFARSFLVPADAASRHWRELRKVESVRVAAVRTASHFRVDMSTLARRLQELQLVSSDDAADIRSSRTTRTDIVEYNLLVPADMTGTTVPISYAQAVLRLFRRHEVSRERALGLLWGTFADDDLPDPTPADEGEIWKFVS